MDLDPIQSTRRTKDCSFHYDLPLRAAATKPSSQSWWPLPLAFMQPNAISETSNVPSFRLFMVFHSSLQPYRVPFHLR
jgi:hypothetical protein